MSEFFANLDRYKAGGKGGGDRGAYLRLYNGTRTNIDRIGRGSFAVEHWSAGFLGGIQPGPIQAIAKDAVDDGMLQRFMIIVPGIQQDDQDVRPDHAKLKRYADLFPALAAMRPAGPDDYIALDDEAHRVREAIKALAKAMAAMPDTSKRLIATVWQMGRSVREAMLDLSHD